MALLQYGYVTLARVLDLVSGMPLEDKAQKALRATIRRWAKAVRDAGPEVEARSGWR